MCPNENNKLFKTQNSNSIPKEGRFGCVEQIVLALPTLLIQHGFSQIDPMDNRSSDVVPLITSNLLIPTFFDRKRIVGQKRYVLCFCVFCNQGNYKKWTVKI